MGNTVMVNRTGAVGLYCGPGGVGLALPGGGATEQVAVHAGVDDRVGERRPVQTEDSPVTGRPRVTTLDRCGEGEREGERERGREEGR